MCKPKPGSRCVTDSEKPYETSLVKFEDLSAKLIDADGDEITDTYTDVQYDSEINKLHDIADGLNTKKIFLAAALAKAEGALDEDPKKALAASRKITEHLDLKEAGLSVESQKLLNNNYQLSNRQIVQAGIYLTEFQSLADQNRKDMGKNGSQLANARFMAEHGVSSTLSRLQRKLDAERDAKLALNAKGMNKETVINDHRVDSAALLKASMVAQDDANAVLDRDIKKNSMKQSYQGTDIHQVSIQKNRDGSFSFTVSQDIKAPNVETALRRHKDSFNKSVRDSQVTVAVPNEDSNIWSVVSKYTAQVGDNLPDAYSHQQKIWLGTPDARKKKRN